MSVLCVCVSGFFRGLADELGVLVFRSGVCLLHSTESPKI